MYKNSSGKGFIKSEGERSTRSDCHQKHSYEVMPQTSLKTRRAALNWITKMGNMF